ncbi:hypothetical protein Tco_1559600 [Tanacetum coccineum]
MIYEGYLDLKTREKSDYNKVKYGVERVVNYANISSENFCFPQGLIKSIEPICYKDAILDNNWIDAMNAEIEALNMNHT